MHSSQQSDTRKLNSSSDLFLPSCCSFVFCFQCRCKHVQRGFHGVKTLRGRKLGGGVLVSGFWALQTHLAHFPHTWLRAALSVSLSAASGLLCIAAYLHMLHSLVSQGLQELPLSSSQNHERALKSKKAKSLFSDTSPTQKHRIILVFAFNYLRPGSGLYPTIPRIHFYIRELSF